MTQKTNSPRESQFRDPLLSQPACMVAITLDFSKRFLNWKGLDGLTTLSQFRGWGGKEHHSSDHESYEPLWMEGRGCVSSQH